MIDPFRYLPQEVVSFEVDERLSCERCAVAGGASRKAVRLCESCERYKLLCDQCDLLVHRSAARRTHPRREVLVGKGYSKHTVRHGDRVHFPHELDLVKVKYTVAVTRHGKTVWKRNRPKVIRFHSGSSGTCVHVQLLGCDDLPATNVQGLSDPFCAVYWKDKLVEMTTTRYETREPRWADQTSVIPVDYEQFHGLNPYEVSHKEFLRVEVFARMLMNRSRLLGHATLEKTELSRLAKLNNEEIVRLPITFKTTRGALGVRVGIQTDDALVVQVVEGVDLDKMDIIGLSDPYVKVFANGHEPLGKTPVQPHTLNPRWTSQNIFVIPPTQSMTDGDGIRFEVLDYDRFSRDDTIGDAILTPELLQLLLQQIPASSAAALKRETAVHSPTAQNPSLLHRLSRRMSSSLSDRRLARLRAANTPIVQHWSEVVFLDIQSEFQASLNKQKPTGAVLVRVLPSSRGEIIRGLDRAVKEMSLGERAVVHLRYDYAYGILCIGPAIPPKSTLIFRIQLLQINQKGALRGVYRAIMDYKNRMRARVGLQLDPTLDFMAQGWSKDARSAFSMSRAQSQDVEHWNDTLEQQDEESKISDFADEPTNLHELEAKGDFVDERPQSSSSNARAAYQRNQQGNDDEVQVPHSRRNSESPPRPDRFGFKTAAGIGAGAKRFFR